MKTPLKQAVRAHLEEPTLSEEQLAALEARFGIRPPAPKSKPAQDASPTPAHDRLRQRSWFWTLAAIVALGIGSVFVLFASPSGDSLPESIAEEVVRNHLKRKPLDVEVASVDDARGAFDKLDFALVESGDLNQSSEMLGGRYCSLLGAPAAQLRFRTHLTGSVDTVYQVPYDAERFGKLPNAEHAEAPLRTYARGIEVTIWVEKGIVFARTHDRAR